MAPTTLGAVVALLLLACSQGQDLSRYENSKILVSGKYELYWTYRPASSMLEMAVRVKTLGWFGLGISPDGQMSNSDVVIGWVTAGGTAMLRVSGNNTQLVHLLLACMQVMYLVSGETLFEVFVYD